MSKQIGTFKVQRVYRDGQSTRALLISDQDEGDLLKTGVKIDLELQGEITRSAKGSGSTGKDSAVSVEYAEALAAGDTLTLSLTKTAAESIKKAPEPKKAEEPKKPGKFYTGKE